jgi:hypothetical protein
MLLATQPGQHIVSKQHQTAQPKRAMSKTCSMPELVENGKLKFKVVLQLFHSNAKKDTDRKTGIKRHQPVPMVNGRAI